MNETGVRVVFILKDHDSPFNSWFCIQSKIMIRLRQIERLFDLLAAWAAGLWEVDTTETWPDGLIRQAFRSWIWKSGFSPPEWEQVRDAFDAAPRK
jgi:hypothetical protein